MGKSLLLLTLAYHIAKYNKHLKPKDPNKRLTVLYITQENSLKETISRLWNIAISDDNIINFDFQEVKEAFRQAGLFTDDNTSINIKLQYIPHKQLTVDDMYGKIEEMSDNNEEVIAVIHDYTKRLKNTYPTGDPRIDLGEIINEWQSFAKYFGIPVITAGQINRNGQTIIEDAVQNNQEDIGKKLNAHNIGESFLLYENTDYAYIITREMKASEKRYYLAIKEIKARDKRLPAGEIDIKYFVHPYEQNNPARLCEDLDLKQSLSKLQVSDNVLGGGTEDENGNIIPPSNNNVGRRSRLNNAGSRRRKMEVETVSENSDDLV